jgi:hypothetical protein
MQLLSILLALAKLLENGPHLVCRDDARIVTDLDCVANGIYDNLLDSLQLSKLAFEQSRGDLVTGL